MRRGDIWTVSGGKDYAGKPRPVVIIQDDRFDATRSITICSVTRTVPSEFLLRDAAEPARLPLLDEERVGLARPAPPVDEPPMPPE